MTPLTFRSNLKRVTRLELAQSPIEVMRPERQTAPVVFASPHSGNYYPDDFVALSCLDDIELRRSEDAFVHELYDQCVIFGSPLLRANFPRAYVDINREPYELDPGMFVDKLPSFVNVASPRAQAGLGTIAKVVTNGVEIYDTKLDFPEVHNRIETFYHPYHAALVGLIDATKKRHGGCILLDCHSMPSIGIQDQDKNAKNVDVVLGDRFGSSCGAWLTDMVQRQLEQNGFHVRRNRPYAGGFTTKHYGHPDDQVHVLQIELNRNLYMDEENILRREEFDSIKQRLTPMIQKISALSPDQFGS